MTPRPRDGDVDELSGAERVQVELRRALALLAAREKTISAGSRNMTQSRKSRMPTPVRKPSCVMPRKSVARKAKNVPAVVIAAMNTPGIVERMIVRIGVLHRRRRGCARRRSGRKAR